MVGKMSVEVVSVDLRPMVNILVPDRDVLGSIDKNTYYSIVLSFSKV
jgi:hypothetical protein